MKKKTLIELGHGVECDVDRLIESRGLVQASSGGGKSWTLRRLFEQTHPFVQQLIIDPEGEFFTLRERFDYILAAKEGGDVIAHPLYAAKLAIKLLELRTSAILDLYELPPHARILFVQNFLTAIVNAPKTLWHPVLIGLDEAHVFAPESGHALSLNSVIDVATRGRKRGQCLICGTQRISSLSKDVAAQLKNKLIGNTTLDIDMKRAGDELGFEKSQRLELRKIDQGEFYAFGPAISKEIVKVKIGPVITSHEKKAGIAMQPPPPTKKIRALLEQLSELPAEAEAEIHSLEDYRKKNTELEAEVKRLGKMQPPAPAPVKPIEVKVYVVEDKDISAIEGAQSECELLTTELKHGLEEVSTLRKTLDATLARLKTIGAYQTALAAAPAQTRLPEVPNRLREHIARRAAAVSTNGTGNGELNKVERALLTAFAQHPEGLTKGEAVMHAGYRASGDTATAFSRFNANGWIRTAGNGDAVTDEGLQTLGAYDPLPTGSALREQIKNSPRFSPVEKKLITVIFDSYPESVSKGAAVEAAGYKPSGDTATAFSKFATLGYVDKMGSSLLRANARLFLE